MFVSDPQSSTATVAQRSNASEGSAAGSMISSDFETFLKMLTVQLENQDPLNPIESTDYAVQLATFSGVEQQVRTNDLLDDVKAQLGVMSMSDLVGWVGMEARAAVPVHFDLEPVTVEAEIPANAQQAFMVVRDTDGTQLDRIALSLTEDSVVWAGLDDTGTLFPEGNYSFFLQSYGATGLIEETQMQVYAKVVEARIDNGITMLRLDSGREISADEVDALRAPKD